MAYRPSRMALAAICLGLHPIVLAPAGAGAQVPLQEVPFDHKLVASTGAASDRFGTALAVSGDVMVAAAPSATADGKLFAGAAHVFVRDPASGRWAERKRLV